MGHARFARWPRIGLVWALCALPTWIPMLTVTTDRAAHARDTTLFHTVPFTVITLFMGVLVYGAAGVLVVRAAVVLPDGEAEQQAGGAGLIGGAVGSVILFVGAFFTPLDWPGPAGAWGRGLASAMGVRWAGPVPGVARTSPVRSFRGRWGGACSWWTAGVSTRSRPRPGPPSRFRPHRHITET
ncbi:hypothetical protein AB0A94_14990 [Streptomyces sp. NPDC044984]|uniref:hypothetical protein n=1 Tax=Streptomyces sp. NPDC044984 TaxID=3154335 RepID=UPI0034119283